MLISQFWLILLALVKLCLCVPTVSDLEKRHWGNKECIRNACPGLDFKWRSTYYGIMNYDMNVIGVNYLGKDSYEVTIHVVGDKQIPLKFLYSLSISNIGGPDRIVPLHHCDKGINKIDNPTDFTATFVVNSRPDLFGRVWMPDFKLDFEYVLGPARQYAKEWKWGKRHFHWPVVVIWPISGVVRMLIFLGLSGTTRRDAA